MNPLNTRALQAPLTPEPSFSTTSPAAASPKAVSPVLASSTSAELLPVTTLPQSAPQPTESDVYSEALVYREAPIYRQITRHLAHLLLDQLEAEENIGPENIGQENAA